MIIIWIISVFLLARYLPLPKLLTKSPIFRFLIAISSSLILFSVLALIFYFIKIPTHPIVYLLILLAISIFFAVKLPKNSLKFTKQDFILLLPALIVVLFFGVNIFLDGYGKHNVSQTAMIQSISKAEDDAGNHLMLFSRFYMNGNSALTHDSYTAGYEWSTSLLANSIVPSSVNPPAIFMVDFYIVFKLVTFGVLILTFTILLFELYKKYISNKLKIPQNFLLCMTSLAFGLFIFTPLYRNGFYSFMPILIFIMAIITLLLSISDQKAKGIVLPYILILTAGISTSWFMAAPVALLVSFVLVLSLWKTKCFWLSTGLFVLNIVVLGLLLTMLLSAGTITSASDALTLYGGYPTLSRFFVATTAILAIGFVIINRPNIKKFANSVSLYVITGVIFALSLLLYFQLTTGVLTYYYLKIETSVLVAILPFSIIFVFYILRKFNFWWQFTVFPIFFALYLTSQLISPNDYIQYITDWNNKAATIEVNAAVPIIEKLSKPIYDEAQNTCTIIVNKFYIETVNSDHIGNNTTNRIAENHCLPDEYLTMHNAGEIDYKLFVDYANKFGVKYEIYTSELGGGPKVVNITNDSSVGILNY